MDEVLHITYYIKQTTTVKPELGGHIWYKAKVAL